METTSVLKELQQIEVVFRARKQLVTYLKSQDVKIRKAFLLCNIVIMLNYFIIIFNIIKLYTSIKTGYEWYLIITLSFIYISFVILLLFQSKVNVYKPGKTNVIVKEFLNYKIQTTNHKIKFITSYVVTYSFITIFSLFFFLMVMDNSQVKILNTILPLFTIVNVVGLFLLLKLNKIKKIYTDTVLTINKNIIGQSSEQ